MTRHPVTIRQVSGTLVVVTGPESFSLVRQATRRTPVWSDSERGWCCHPKAAARLANLAAASGLDVVLSAGGDPGSPVTQSVTRPATHPEPEGLW